MKKSRPKKPPTPPRKMSAKDLCMSLAGIAAFHVEDKAAQMKIYEAGAPPAAFGGGCDRSWPFAMRWDEWRGSMDGRPVLWVKHLLCGHGIHIDIHKMVAPDDAECFHTHPAYAVRIILWGGYAEELEGSRWRMWRPGMIGLVRPTCSHRIAGFRNGRVSYSLWIRFRKVAKVIMRGSGWANQEQTHRVPDTLIEAT